MEKWNEEEGVLTLTEFKPQVPKNISLGIQASKDPVKRQELKDIFLTALRATGLVKDAAAACQIPTSLAFTWKYEDPEFSFRWDKIVQGELLPHLEAEAIRRAMNGSDLLMIFMLKSMARDKYDDKVAEKNVDRPSVLIQIRDVDNSLVAVSDAKMVENGQRTEVKIIDAEVKEARQLTGRDESTSSTEGTDQK